MSKEMQHAVARIVLAMLVSVLVVTQSQAGVLATATNAYVDGSSRVWHGSTPFDADNIPNNNTLQGVVDWAVFGPNQLPGNFVLTGYTPTPNEYTYTYQLFVTDTVPDTSFSVVIHPNPADNPGYFTSLGGILPLTSSVSPTQNVSWTYNVVGNGQFTAGLAFSSAQAPTDYFGSTVDHGTSAITFPIPSPGPNSIPEPASAVMAVLTLLAVCGARVRGRSRTNNPAAA